MTSSSDLAHQLAVAAEIGLQDRRCGTCKHWRPRAKRDAPMDCHYGACVAPLPAKIPACFDRSFGERWGTAHSAGTNCAAWKADGKHGDLR